jgi:hypothetical protein
MYLPHFWSPLAILMYFLLLYIIVIGIWHFSQIRMGKDINPFFQRSTIPLGLTAVALGFLGFFKSLVESMEAISVNDNISPAIVAGGYADAGSFVILGFLTLAFSGVFRYVNYR